MLGRLQVRGLLVGCARVRSLVLMPRLIKFFPEPWTFYPMTTPSTKHPMNSPSGKRAFDRRVRRHAVGRPQTFYAIVAPGCEAFCESELIAIGIQPSAPAADSGGVAFGGRFVDCQRANLHLRTATRILLRLDTFTATNRRQLEKRSGAIGWELWLSPQSMPDVKVSSHRSRLHHTQAIAQTIREGIARRLNSPEDSTVSIYPQTVFVRTVADRFTLSLDSSGKPLYKRGLKRGPARAPIRETLAASILMAAGYDPRQPLVDPLCGSGTFSLEAAMMAKRIAPGANRSFAFMGWPAFGEGRWAFLKRQAESQKRSWTRPLIFASDLDADACKRLTRTIEENGLVDIVRVAQKDLFSCRASQYGGGRGLVAINPPYGIRLGSAKQANDLFMAICRHLAEQFRGWRVALVVPRRELLRQLPFSARQVPLFHGGLRLTVVVGTIQ